MLTREASEESVEPSNLKSGPTSRHTGQGREGVAAAGRKGRPRRRPCPHAGLRASAQRVSAARSDPGNKANSNQASLSADIRGQGKPLLTLETQAVRAGAVTPTDVEGASRRSVAMPAAPASLGQLPHAFSAWSWVQTRLCQPRAHRLQRRHVPRPGS